MVVRGDFQIFPKNLDFSDTGGDLGDNDDYYSKDYDIDTHVAMHGDNTEFIDSKLCDSSVDEMGAFTVTSATAPAVNSIPTSDEPSALPPDAVASHSENTGRKLLSPVVNRASLMLVMALAVTKQMYIFICDVKGAFLYADLYEDEFVYVRPPPGWRTTRGFVVRV